MGREKEPFDQWSWGDSTHWEDCWKVHVTCALWRATDMLADFLESTDCSTGFEEQQGFVDFVRANR